MLEEQKQPAPSGQGPLWLRRIAWFGIGLLLLWMLAWVAVPPLLKWQLQVRLSEALGRSVTIGDVGFKPWTLEFTVGDLTIAGAPAAAPATGSATAAGAAPSSAKVEPLLQLQRLHVNLSGSSLFRLAPVLEEFDLDSPVIRLTRTAPGHYDIDDLIARFTPKPDPAAKPSEPARFALYNVQVRNAQLRFDDRPVGRVHKVEMLDLSLPFISNLPAQVDVKVEPRLAFKLNGSAFDSGAQATPFAQARNGTLNWKTPNLDLAPYLPYLPESLPVRIKQGSVSTDIVLQFEAPQGGRAKATLRGSFGARDLVLTDAAGGPLLNWRQLQLGLRDVEPLARKLAFDTLRVEGAQLFVSRDAQGGINLLKLAGAPAGSASAPASAPSSPASPASPVASEPASAASGGTRSASPADPNAWQVSLGAIQLADARVQWSDATSRPDVALQIDSLAMDVKQVNWPVAGPMPLHVAGTLRSQAQGAAPSGTFEIDGPLTDRDAKLGVKLDGVALDLFAPYVGQFVTAKLDGRLAAQAQLDWSGAAEAQRLKLGVEKATLDAVRVQEAAHARPSKEAKDAKDAKESKDTKDGSGAAFAEGVALKQLALTDLQLDLIARTAAIGGVKLVEPRVGIVRERDGKLGVQRWLTGESGAKPEKGAAPHPAGKAAASPAWRVALKDFSIDNGQLQLVDNAALRLDSRAPTRIDVSALKLGLQNFEWRGEHAVPPAKLALNARVGAPAARGERAGRTGSIDWAGQVGLQPLLANGKLKVERLPVHLFAPYAGTLPVDLVRAEAGYSGTLALRQSASGLDVTAGGDVLLGDVHVATLPDANTRAGVTSADELLNWQALALKGLSFSMKPGTKPLLEIREASLSDFYSRLVVTEQGRFNLRDVAGPEPAASAPAAVGSAASSAAAAPPASAPPAAAPVAASAASGAASAPTDAGLPIDVRIGATKLINGKVDFSDRFVRPNYSAALSELNGQLGAFRSDSREMATLELRGRAAGTALLEISGQVNPTVKPLALDIRAKATDLELAPLSPYAGKYAGYAIERGKLSMDVAYKIDADGKLNASNQVILNQLTFGEKIASPEATKLPVLLAVALLKDRNGVIDINLPVSGSINDPQFSVGGIIVKVIFNLIAKALTAPFSLLAGGGKDDLSLVEFKPGTSTIAADSVGTIDKVAKALNDRPALKMTVTGAADPASEREAFQQAALDARLAAEQRREALRSGAAPAPAPASAASGAAPSEPAPMSADERNRLLKEVYKQTDIPNKPRNVLGFQKDIPPAEMEALLKTRLLVTEEGMRELALQRGIAVRDALIAKGLPSERLFLAAPKLRVSGEDDAKWTPRVQLTLSTN